MQEKINLWSFIFSIICVVLFLTFSFSGRFTNSILGIHPLNIILFVSLFTFLFGVYGFSGVRDGKSMARSISTVVVTLGLSAYMGFVLMFGSLLH
ncbi:hypothetical protein [Sutcliffiella horikoshii]|uniref:Uncharacterized protein n=1 Tax=Sutcliffiella horikoshii TaxID=79883 RepID=A0A5D4T8W5_9BACI|nr:hypothetical protein [Sutcliffiella horikoshii]TYS71719.1 hypothetical protein FZC75_11175 [Sutcliffiella horikoshii]